jgi:hypothetical protein
VLAHIHVGVFSQTGRFWGRKFLGISRKCLISKCFGSDPENLWITLLKTCRQRPESLANQAFRQIAHLLGNFKKFNEIKDLKNCGGRDVAWR